MPYIFSCCLGTFLSAVIRHLQILMFMNSKLFVYKCEQLLRKHDSFKLFLMGESSLYTWFQLVIQ